MKLALFVSARAAASSLPTLPRRPRAPGAATSEPEVRGHDTCCTICGGIAIYPVAPGTIFYSTMTVPGLPLNTSAWEVATYYIYCELTAAVSGDRIDGINQPSDRSSPISPLSPRALDNIFFDNYVPAGAVYDQFVPQLMLGPALSGTTGPPHWDATFATYESWVFSAQYFFEIGPGPVPPGQQGIPKAATGAIYNCSEGETLYTRFSLANSYDGLAWTLEMGVVGDPSRTSSVVAPQPFMGLLANVTTSWSESTYDHVHVNGCWELYDVDTPHAFPSTGSQYFWSTTTGRANEISPWYTDWSNIEVPTCSGAPNATFTEVHSDTQQNVTWDIFFP